MVGDVHRILLKGGVFLYPPTHKAPEGKLRLMYEANPMAMIVEQAGGKTLAAPHKRILDIEPTEIHQRTPVAENSPDGRSAVILAVPHLRHNGGTRWASTSNSTMDRLSEENQAETEMATAQAANIFFPRREQGHTTSYLRSGHYLKSNVCNLVEAIIPNTVTRAVLVESHDQSIGAA